MKNKTIQKMFATVLATILAVGCLTACGDEAANNVDDKTASASQSSEIQESEVSEEPEDPKEPVQINYVRYSGKSTVTPDLQMVEDAINEYIEPLINVTIDMKTRADLGGDIPLALAAGEDIDLFWANSGTSYDIMINGGAYDVTEKIKEYPDLYSLIPESVWEISTHLGRNYYIPIPKEFGTGYSVLVNKEYADKYFWNLSAVDELKDLEPMLADLKAEGVDYPFLNWSSYYDRWGSDEFDFITKYAGVERNGDTGKVVSIYETDAYKEYVDLKYSWNQAGYINQAEIETLKSATVKELKANGEIGFAEWVNVPNNEGFATADNPYEVALAKITDNYLMTGVAFGSAYMINGSADEETVNACMKFLNLLYTDETLANLLTYGIEGTHYDIVDGRATMKADSGYTTSGVWSITTVYTPTLSPADPENKEEEYKAFNAVSLPSSTAGFTFDQTSVEAEVSAITAVINEYRNLLEKGFYNPDEYLPIMVDALKSAGLDKVIDEIQTQYDTWLTSK